MKAKKNHKSGKKVVGHRRVVGNFGSFAEAITAGGYNDLYGYALSPEDIKGATTHTVDAETKLTHLGHKITTKKLVEKLPNLVDLSTLLAFGAQFPSTMREFRIVTVWQDETGQFWCAVLHGDSSWGHLGVYKDDPGDEWDGRCRFLVHKTA